MFNQWLPESCRFYLAAGEREKAVEMLASMSKMNKKELPPGELLDAAQVSHREPKWHGTRLI